jgi:hypothetical protein
MDLKSIRGPQLSSRPLSLNTLSRFQACYPSHCGPLECRLYPPGDCARAGNLVSFILGTYKGDWGAIMWYLGHTSGHAL